MLTCRYFSGNLTTTGAGGELLGVCGCTNDAELGVTKGEAASTGEMFCCATDGCCYFGPPDESLKFFGVKDDFADIYNQLEKEENVIQQATKFRQSDYHRRYIANHLSPGTQTQQRDGVKTQPGTSTWKQLGLLTQRYFQITKRDCVNLALALLTAPIGISLITLAVRNKDPLVLGNQADPSLAPLALRVLFVFTCRLCGWDFLVPCKRLSKNLLFTYESGW